MPTTYYDINSGVGIAVRFHPNYQAGHNLKVGVIGLGIGTIATYGREGDEYRFYEINPDSQFMADTHFTYLSESDGDNTVVIGDARISMERELEEGSQQFDILVLDAFSGDAIPVHLLTREAVEIYWRHLKPDGILAMHITNLHFDLSDVARTLADEFHKVSVPVRDNGDNFYDFPSNWVLLTSNREYLEKPEIANRWQKGWSRPRAEKILWTDDFSNPLQVLMLD